ncbi:ABC transporter permease [Marinivivus vitaminiproducens]|uniref:ABC transporter permease n=1 Tax=Marinivivus vitaminiproducens TaxID=3035935 RepID=UPI0027A9C668|nr:ABC transporter permease [Geminicoccaceae bacterium SCSIO 64248]
MAAYIVRRLILTFPVLLGVSVIVFLVISLIPGDPATAILGNFATPENVENLNRSLGLDRPLPVQYLTWLTGVVQGDLGRSYALNRPVLDEVAERLGPTLILASAALFLCVLLGVVAGVWAAVRQYGWADRIITLVVLVGISTPSFFLGILVILWFAVRLRWFPTGGMYDLFSDGGVRDLLWHLVLPAATLAVVATGVVARLTRANMLEVLRQDYVRTARAKGLREGAVIGRHALRNAIVNIVPIIGIQAGFVLGGAVYVETVFQWPGIGRMLVDAISARDILLVQGGVLVVATAFVLINLVTDIVQTALDPRLRTG